MTKDAPLFLWSVGSSPAALVGFAAACAAWRCGLPCSAGTRAHSDKMPQEDEPEPEPEPKPGTKTKTKTKTETETETESTPLAHERPSKKLSKRQRRRAEAAAAAARAAGETGPLNRKGKPLGKPTPCGGAVNCAGCGTSFSSRNAMFRHIRTTGCGGQQVQRVERYVVLYGYVGTNYFGSQRNAQEDEERCPTVEGTLLAAIRAASMRHKAATAASAEVHSRASRTDRGVHALANVVHIKIVTEFEKGSAAPPPLDCPSWLEAVRTELPPTVTVLQRFELSKQPDLDMRRACQKREYRYYVPYRALLTSEENAVAARKETRVWVAGLPDVCDADVLRAFASKCWADAENHDKATPLRQVILSEHPGSATLHMESPADAETMAAAIDGAVGFPGAEPKGLMALLESDATVRRTAHQRLRDALRLLTGTRSFHNFCPHFYDSSDGKSVRSVYRCRSGMTAGYHAKMTGLGDFAVLTITGRSFLYHQILKMMGLVLAVAGGLVSRDYVALAFSKIGGVEVPLAPSGNLVLAECCFKDKAFAPTVDGFGAKRSGISTLSKHESAIRSAIDVEVASPALQSEFDSFLCELRTVIAPRMTTALSSISTRVEVPEVKHVPGFSAEVSLKAVLDSLGDAPRSYTMGHGDNAGHSHRRVAWLGDGIDVPYTYAGHSFEPLPLPPLLVEVMSSASRTSGTNFNAVNVNIYDDNDSVLARHRDDEAIFTCDEVASVSFGAARRFRIFHPEGGLAFDEPLFHGDLVIFPRMWEHEVLKGSVPTKSPDANSWDVEEPQAPLLPVATQEANVRVNLTFRQV